MEEVNKKSFWKSSWGIIIIICFIIILGGAVIFIINVLDYKEKIEAGEPLTEFQETEEVKENINTQNLDRVYPGRDNNPTIGLPTAKVEVIFFEDFECPICAQLFPVKKQIIEEYSDRVVFVFRHFPMDSIHENARNAALASECAHEQGAFWPMHDKIFSNQGNLNETDLKSYAQEIGINTLLFDDCFNNRTYEDEIDKDFQQGIYHDVQGTPTFFVNGEKFEGVPTDEYFRGLLDFYLEKE